MVTGHKNLAKTVVGTRQSTKKNWDDKTFHDTLGCLLEGCVAKINDLGEKLGHIQLNCCFFQHRVPAVPGFSTLSPSTLMISAKTVLCSGSSFCFCSTELHRQSFHCFLFVCWQHSVTTVDATVMQSGNAARNSGSAVQRCLQQPSQNAPLAGQPAKDALNSDPALTEVTVERVF